jgi:hypothetical protein
MLTYESKWIYTNLLLPRVVIIIIIKNLWVLHMNDAYRACHEGYSIAGLLVVATEGKFQISFIKALSVRTK